MSRVITSLELPDESSYRLTKSKAVNQNSWVISEGQSVTGDLRTNPIKVGERCCVGRGMRDVISTSLVKKIKLDKKNPKKYTLETENSIYTLEELEDVN